MRNRLAMPVDAEMASRLAEYRAHLFRRVRDSANPADCKSAASGAAQFDSVALHQFDAVHADLAYWLCSSLPSWPSEFDSRNPLQFIYNGSVACRLRQQSPVYRAVLENGHGPFRRRMSAQDGSQQWFAGSMCVALAQRIESRRFLQLAYIVVWS